ncbi:hypothetical protein PCANC_19262 [Puccinia coronata f. sp. avenae]|uniref:Uncharacterized protein n=1 Tax=Puccinia coronata f. sp. avenae TaxID=200324 RepID=A0A2N5UFF7_9BASI|nr:hypothetical protein PCANC_19262 [Puccinia coronata f. sp. avenae]
MCTKSVHGKVRLTAESDDQGSRKIPISRKAWEGVECHWADHATYSQLALIVSCESLAIPPTVISFPTHTINKLHANGIECMDVAGEWIVTWGKNGTLRLDPWLKSNPSETSLSHRTGRGHLSDITSCQFFPSGEVILTTSINMSARIYSIHPDPRQPGSTSLMMNVRSFTAPHSCDVSAAGIIGKGKEIVTACRDGKLRIWNVADSTVMTEGSWPGASSVSARGIHVAPKRFLDSTGTPAPLIASQSQDSPLFLVLALLSGALHFADLPSLKPIKLRTSCITMDHAADSPIEALAVLRSAKLISWGTRTGTVSLTPLASWRCTTAAVNSLQFVNHDAALLVAGNNGLPYRISFATPQPVILEEFAGYNCDPVAAICLSCTHGQVFSAGKEGNVLVWNRPPSHSPSDS